MVELPLEHSQQRTPGSSLRMVHHIDHTVGDCLDCIESSTDFFPQRDVIRSRFLCWNALVIGYFRDLNQFRTHKSSLGPFKESSTTSWFMSLVQRVPISGPSVIRVFSNFLQPGTSLKLQNTMKLLNVIQLLKFQAHCLNVYYNILVLY